VRFEVFTTVSIQVEVFWVETPWKMEAARSHDGDLLQHYTPSQPRKPQLL